MRRQRKDLPSFLSILQVYVLNLRVRLEAGKVSAFFLVLRGSCQKNRQRFIIKKMEGAQI